MLIEDSMDGHDLSDDARMELAKQILEWGMPDTNVTLAFDQDAVTEMLEFKDYEVEWLQHEDAILLCLLWKYGPDPEHKLLDEFIIEYAGHDASIISLFCMTRSTQV